MQEKIKEGIQGWVDKRFGVPNTFNTQLLYDFLVYLHSQGVVIKVDGKLPVEVVGDITLAGVELLTKEIKDLLPQLGYTAFESLIKEGE